MAALARYAFEPAIRRIISLESDFVLAHHPIVEGVVAMVVKKREGIPYVTVEHSMTDLSIARAHPSRERLYRDVLEHADHWFAVNKRMARLMADLAGTHATSSDLEAHVLYNGSPDTGGTPTFSTEGRPPIVLSVGSLIRRKGFHHLIAALGMVEESFPDFRCLIVGGGSELVPLVNQIHSLGLDGKVRIDSALPRDDLLQIFASCDFFVLASVEDPLPVVFLEAMAFGKPVIATQDEGISELVTQGREGLLVRRDDPADLARAILQLLLDSELRQRMGRAARVLAESLSWRANASKLVLKFK